LHQGQVERRLAVDVFEAVQRGAQALAGRVEAGLPLAAAPIEQYRRVASADSQDFQGMVRRVRRQLDMRTGMQGEWAEEPRYHGRIIPKSRMQRMASLSPPVCDFGRPAIDFDLPGVDGRRHTLASTRGSNGLLVMFICNHCPYVKAVLDRIIRDARELAALGVGSIAVMSNDPGEYPEDSWDNMLRLARELDFPFPYVLDESQAVARAYGAVCTPDFFGYNAKLELQYRGRLDESRKEAASPTVRRELFEAMRAVAETGLGPRQQIPSIGCSIKWCEA
jgi:peroxiredoxin